MSQPDDWDDVRAEQHAALRAEYVSRYRRALGLGGGGVSRAGGGGVSADDGGAGAGAGPCVMHPTGPPRSSAGGGGGGGDGRRASEGAASLGGAGERPSGERAGGAAAPGRLPPPSDLAAAALSGHGELEDHHAKKKRLGRVPGAFKRLWGKWKQAIIEPAPLHPPPQRHVPVAPLRAAPPPPPGPEGPAAARPSGLRRAAAQLAYGSGLYNPAVSLDHRPRLAAPPAQQQHGPAEGGALEHAYGTEGGAHGSGEAELEEEEGAGDGSWGEPGPGPEDQRPLHAHAASTDAYGHRVSEEPPLSPRLGGAAAAAAEAARLDAAASAAQHDAEAATRRARAARQRLLAGPPPSQAVQAPPVQVHAPAAPQPPSLAPGGSAQRASGLLRSGARSGSASHSGGAASGAAAAPPAKQPPAVRDWGVQQAREDARWPRDQRASLPLAPDVPRPPPPLRTLAQSSAAPLPHSASQPPTPHAAPAAAPELSRANSGSSAGGTPREHSASSGRCLPIPHLPPPAQSPSVAAAAAGSTASSIRAHSRLTALQQFVAAEEARLEAQLVSLAARQQLLAGIVLSLPPGTGDDGGGAAARMRRKLLDEERRVESEADALQARGAALAASAARLASTLELLSAPSSMGDEDRLGLLQLLMADVADRLGLWGRLDALDGLPRLGRVGQSLREMVEGAPAPAPPPLPTLAEATAVLLPPPPPPPRGWQPAAQPRPGGGRGAAAGRYGVLPSEAAGGGPAHSEAAAEAAAATEMDPDHELYDTMASIFSADATDDVYGPPPPRNAPRAHAQQAGAGQPRPASAGQPLLPGGAAAAAPLPVLAPVGGTPAKLLRRRGLSLDIPGAHQELAHSLAATGALKPEETEAFSTAFERLARGAGAASPPPGLPRPPPPGPAALRSPGAGAVAAIKESIRESAQGGGGAALPPGYEGFAAASHYAPRPGHARGPANEGFIAMGPDAAAPPPPAAPVPAPAALPAAIPAQLPAASAAGSAIEAMSVRDLLGLLVSTLQQNGGGGGGGGADVDKPIGQLLRGR
ncbi:hypothetical protein Rsub_03636 [Raphidocelis subcapitata]|uniref:Uncharacterized protein n=1 Tax=Raphidocelis subcapitata TaxID=307507 RepID=A0A2V0NUJ8_9CHLO|nr:hypothetical protein Rsub_03636 [Raphidocelis subcapitata]|eukprot:GBF91316.1 hypothetical protein Rsub_03636 [Raphidocelis subcapitata]